MNKTLKTIQLIFFISLSVLVAGCCNSTSKAKTETSESQIFPKGEKITNSNFTGDVWLQNLVSADSLNQNAVGSVTFEPGARTKWHSHPAGQIILALDGVGYYQEKGKPIELIRKGEVVKCPPDIPHWHGASPNRRFIQLAITGRENGPTVWYDLVTDEEYNDYKEENRFIEN